MQASQVRSHKDLVVWEKSIVLCKIIYQITETFPQREIYALSSQMRRAAVSISSNIAEGRSRGTRKDFAHFLRMAYGSASELETQLLIAHELRFLNDSKYEEANRILSEVSRMLRAMISKLETAS